MNKELNLPWFKENDDMHVGSSPFTFTSPRSILSQETVNQRKVIYYKVG